MSAWFKERRNLIKYCTVWVAFRNFSKQLYIIPKELSHAEQWRNHTQCFKSQNRTQNRPRDRLDSNWNWIEISRQLGLWTISSIYDIAQNVLLQIKEKRFPLCYYNIFLSCLYFFVLTYEIPIFIYFLHSSWLSCLLD